MNITSFKYCEENEVGRVVLDLFFLEELYVVKANVQHLSFNMSLCSPWTYNKSKLYKCSDFWSRDKLDFDFFRKNPDTSFWTTFCVWCSRRMFWMLYSVTWPDSIVWLLLVLEILGNMRIEIICFPVCVVINFEINRSFLI